MSRGAPGAPFRLDDAKEPAVRGLADAFGDGFALGFAKWSPLAALA